MGKLKGVPDVLSPDILSLLAGSGHGDEIVLADINFPVKSTCNRPGGPKEYRADGLTITTLLEAIVTLMPVDAYVDKPVTFMRVMERDAAILPAVTKYWEECMTIVNKHEARTVDYECMDRFLFYGKAKSAYAIIQTGDKTPYGNVILKRGVVN